MNVLIACIEKRDIQGMRRAIHGVRTVDAEDERGLAPLLLCALVGFLKGVKLLVEEAGADVDYAEGEMKLTALFCAAREGHVNVVRYLVGKGAMTDKAHADGSTPLYMASQKGHIEVVRLLLRAGADVNKATNDVVYRDYTSSAEIGVFPWEVQSGATINVRLPLHNIGVARSEFRAAPGIYVTTDRKYWPSESSMQLLASLDMFNVEGEGGKYVIDRTLTIDMEIGEYFVFIHLPMANAYDDFFEWIFIGELDVVITTTTTEATTTTAETTTTTTTTEATTEATTATTATTTTTSSSSPSNENVGAMSMNSPSSSNSGAIVAVVIVLVVLAACAAALVFYFFVYRRRNDSNNASTTKATTTSSAEAGGSRSRRAAFAAPATSMSPVHSPRGAGAPHSPRSPRSRPRRKSRHSARAFSMQTKA